MKLIIDVPESTAAYLKAVAAAWNPDDERPNAGAVAEVAEHLIEGALLEDHVLDARSQTWVRREEKPERPDMIITGDNLGVYRL
jgi:hypothetical protein